MTPERRLLVGCGRELAGCDLALLIACPKRLSQSACLCLLGNSYHPLCPRLEHPTLQSFLWNKDVCEHVVEMLGNDTWQELASQHSVSGFHKGKRATMEPQMPGRSCCGYDTFLWMVLGTLQAPRNSLLPFNLLAPIVTVTYILYLSPIDLLPMFLGSNIQWKWSFDLKMSARLSNLFSTSIWESKQSKLQPWGALMSAIFLHSCVLHLHLLLSLVGCWRKWHPPEGHLTALPGPPTLLP